VTSKAPATTENNKFTSYKMHHPNACEIIEKQICFTSNGAICVEATEQIIDFYSDEV